jgi:hypothetical protein
MLDTIIYEIGFSDGRSDAYSANVFSDIMYAQWYIEGIQYKLMEGIDDNNTDGRAVKPDDMYIMYGSNKQVRKTTKGWHLCVQWKYGTTSWLSLTDLNEINPLEVDEHEAAESFPDSPDFLWWAPHVLKKRTQKLGIEVPKS